MHKPPLAIMRSDDNSRHFRELGEDFEAATPPINIRAVGGGELNGIGVFAFTFDNDDAATLDRVRAICAARGVELIDWHGITVDLPNEPGALGKMAGALEKKSVNISSLLITGTDGESAQVLVGVDERREQDAVTALEAGGFVVVAHPDDE
jgi:hypothetical protein